MFVFKNYFKSNLLHLPIRRLEVYSQGGGVKRERGTTATTKPLFEEGIT